jgi:hypothetical protein
MRDCSRLADAQLVVAVDEMIENIHRSWPVARRRRTDQAGASQPVIECDWLTANLRSEQTGPS